MVVGAALSLAIQRTVEPVQGIHRGVSGRWFSRLGPIARPVKTWHDTVAGLVYGSIRIGAEVVGRGIDAAWQRPPSTHLSVRAVASGLWGDDLGGFESRLGQPMVLSSSGGTARYRTRRRTRVAILVHGLMQSELCWNGSEDRPGLVEVLVSRTGVDPVTVTYNTGRSVSDNGEILAEIIEERFGGPTGIASVDLIGHSMGGLVARATVEHAVRLEHAWIERLGQVITLGTPHGGAPIEKGLHSLGRMLGVFEPSRPIAEFLDRRSAGIKDLRHGTISRTDDRRPPPDSTAVDHRFVAGLITADPDHPVGRLAGDLLVRRHSAEGGGISPLETVLVTRTTHAGLLDHPGVADRIAGWLS